MKSIYNVTGIIGTYRVELYRNLSHSDAVSLRDELNSKNDFVKASISPIERMQKPKDKHINMIIKEWEQSKKMR